MVLFSRGGNFRNQYIIAKKKIENYPHAKISTVPHRNNQENYGIMPTWKQCKEKSEYQTFLKILDLMLNPGGRIYKMENFVFSPVSSLRSWG